MRPLALDTTTIANPVARSSYASRFNMDPSRYHTASERSSGCSMNQRNVSVVTAGGLDTRTTKKPLVKGWLALAGEIPEVASLDDAGSAGHPCFGQVAVHTNPWAMVPGCCRHNWHLLSVIPRDGTEALRV
jgi:hypothetical protein